MRSHLPRLPLLSRHLNALLDGLCSLGAVPTREVRFCADLVADEGFTLYANGEQLDKAARTAMLAAMRAGDAPPVLEVEAITFLQGDAPNRKFVRFENGILGAFAKSFVGQPFLADHNAWELKARGGTITESKLVKLDDGRKAIKMRLQLVKDWAIEGVLDGTIDRFSIGWSRTDIVKCSVHKGQVFRECDCMPGQKMADGKIVEFVFTGAEGTEVSAVNVPAVVGTGIQAISQLDALDRAELAGILAGELQLAKDKPMIDPQILAALGLSATATLADVLAAISSNKDKLTIATASQATAATELTLLREQSVKRLATERAVVVDAAIAQLAHAGKLKPGSEVELALRRCAERDMDVFSASIKDLLASGLAVTPVGTLPVAGGKDPVPATQVVEGQVLSGKDFIAANPQAAKWLQRAGITVEQFDKHGANAREMIAATSANG